MVKKGLYPVVREVIDGAGDSRAEGGPMGRIRSMTLAEKDMSHQLIDPPVEKAALKYWYAAKVTEILALHMFAAENSKNKEPFCLGQKRVTRERVDAVTVWLGEYMEEPLDLAKLAQHVGCAPHCLSRLFSKEKGKTISQYLRSIRVERAAQLMDSGRYNVTEAAFEVGYNSMSHFTKAFVVEKGLTPSVYLSREAT